jgi:NADH-quinone oxidoreductase subunit C
MTTRLEALAVNLQAIIGAKLARITNHVGELTAECKSADLLDVCAILRDDPALKFEQLIDLCGVDYVDYGEGTWEGQRFAVVYHLLSISLNHRLRLRVFATEDDFPVIPTLVDIWSAANWFEREAFDLYGLMFEGHPDLRRLLTDYGFIGHPFRKDFPMIGNVEMRYDPEQQRVIYQPVSIELRNVVPRMIRDEGFHNG